MTMNFELHLRRAQVYRFLADAFIYPAYNWLDDLPALDPILAELGFGCTPPTASGVDLEALQTEHRYTLGLSGSLPYETEIGMPNEFRQSQEIADIAGFYRAFGFSVGGRVRERPDYLATELEFMCLLALKEAYAMQSSSPEQAEICEDAQRTFLQDHLGRWIGLVAEGLASITDDPQNPYLWLARNAADFVKADADRLGASVQSVPLRSLAPTPLGPELACGDCPAAG